MNFINSTFNMDAILHVPWGDRFLSTSLQMLVTFLLAVAIGVMHRDGAKTLSLKDQAWLVLVSVLSPLTATVFIWSWFLVKLIPAIQAWYQGEEQNSSPTSVSSGSKEPATTPNRWSALTEDEMAEYLSDLLNGRDYNAHWEKGFARLAAL